LLSQMILLRTLWYDLKEYNKKHEEFSVLVLTWQD